MSGLLDASILPPCPSAPIIGDDPGQNPRDPSSKEWSEEWQTTYAEPQLWEVAPTTDEEWDEALKCYALDRHSELASRAAPPQTTVHRGEPLVPLAHGQDPLIHRLESNEDIQPTPPAKQTPRGETGPPPRQQPLRRFSWSPSESSGSNPQSPALEEGSDWHWPPPRQPDSFTVVGGERGPLPSGPSSATHTTRRSSHPPGISDPTRSPQFAHKLSELIGLPRQADLKEECGNSAEAERRAMRAAYNERGWLPAPSPSRNTRIRRAIALRRLGLSGEDDNSVRYSVMSKYTDLLCMIFGVTRAGVSILRGDQEMIYLSISNKRHWTFPADEALATHAVQSPEWRCWVCKDMDKDWRFKNNVARAPGGNPVFIAAAPLRYHLSDGDTVDFGVLSIAAPEAREFGLRDQAMLLRVSNMLVFQLATLQSEIMAKQSRAMYETSINFLRRSFIPERLKSSQRSTKMAEKKRADKKRYQQPHARHHTHGHPGTHGLHSPAPQSRTQPHSPGTMLSRSQSQVPSPISTPPPPARVTKTGPRDAKRIKRRDLESEGHLFSDAAQTLRGILQADAVSVVDLREFQLFVRKTAGPYNQTVGSKESIVIDFLQGKTWPSNVEPVVNFVPRYTSQGVQILGQSNSHGHEFDFSSLTAPDVMRNFIKTYLVTRQHWWDRDDDSELAQQIMMFMPAQGKTVLAALFMTYTGALRFATFAVWDRPPCTFDDSSRLALPFVWIIGATLMSSLAIHRMWTIEESQITYSNLQAHELRTPLHQILAITQLLRSGIADFAEVPMATQDSGLSSMQQVRDLLPLLDAIDTSGTTLHGIVENILTFLDLSAKDYRWGGGGVGNPTVGNRTGVPKTPGAMLEELVHEAFDEDRRERIGSGQELGEIETILEIIPRDLGELVTEDFGGALRRALARVIHNAYRYIDVQGCVEIYVDDVKSMLPPEGCEDLANTRRIAITVTDNGRGMSSDFVREHLGEPWAKEDLYATGSGLSVHLAYRIIDMMNGEMEITSAPGQGCTVSIEVPLPVSRTPLGPSSIVPGRKVALVGFGRNVDPTCTNVAGLAASLQSQYRKLGCEIVDPNDADLVAVNGRLASDPTCVDALASLTAPEFAIFASATDDEQNLVALVSGPTRRVRRFLKPVTPSLVRRTLEEAPLSVPQTPTDGCDPSQPRPRLHFDTAAIDRQDSRRPTPGNSLAWKPRGVCVEEAVAALSLGEYISSRNRLMRANSNGSSGSNPLSPEATLDQRNGPSSEAFAESESRWSMPLVSPGTTASDEVEADAELHETELDILDAVSPVKLKVLVVEDNIINRKILVRILKATLPYLEILEAEDGVDAVDRFRNLGAPLIVLLDINMPRMDGYTAAVEMRRIEKLRAAEAAGALPDDALGTFTPTVRSKIIAITALSGEDERHRGLVECGMDGWVTKPCAKSTLQKVVDEARQELACVVN